jgi:hypothetical protein
MHVKKAIVMKDENQIEKSKSKIYLKNEKNKLIGIRRSREIG